MIEWKQITADVIRGPSAFMPHCEYQIKDLGEDVGQFACRQEWVGQRFRILLKGTRAETLADAQKHCNDWDEAYAR